MTQLAFVILALFCMTMCFFIWLFMKNQLKNQQVNADRMLKMLCTDALKNNNQLFLDLANATLEKFQVSAKGELDKKQQAIDNLVKPIKESLEKFDAKIQTVEKARVGAYEGLTEQIKSLLASEARLRQETANLVKALRTPHVRGRWGEIQLKRVVELAGMLEHCDFQTQQTSSNAEQKLLRPDLVIRLPGSKQIIVDAKAPLWSFLESLENSDEATQQQKLKDHARYIREHMRELSKKSYWSQFQPTPEFVVLFLPGETFFSAALEHDPTLIEQGVEQCVILATPTTLIALLKAVAYGWRQENLAQDATHISILGKDLSKRLNDMRCHFADTGRHLQKAIECYNKTIGSFESRVMVTARKFHALNNSPATYDDSLPAIDIITRHLIKEEKTEEENIAC